jgi:hypothetical protein
MRFKKFVMNLILPKTGIYILLGVIIMFLTFFTTDNAMEIAISGIASIFIGIGVNNFTQTTDTPDKKKAGASPKAVTTLKILTHTKDKLQNTQLLIDKNIGPEVIKNQLKELQDYIDLSIEHLDD